MLSFGCLKKRAALLCCPVGCYRNQSSNLALTLFCICRSEYLWDTAGERHLTSKVQSKIERTHGIFSVVVPDPFKNCFDLDGIVANVVGITRQMLPVSRVNLLQFLRYSLVFAVKVTCHGCELENCRYPILVHYIAGAHETYCLLKAEYRFLPLIFQIQRQIT